MKRPSKLTLRDRTSQQGFTLLEMIISLVIMATLFVTVAATTKQALQAKKKIQEQVDDMSRMRDSLRVMERDINLAFHYQDLEKELQEEVKKAGKSKTPATKSPAGTPAIPSPDDTAKEKAEEENPNRKDPTTHFFGKEDELAFYTLNVGRMNENERQADFVKVGYAITDCKKPGVDGPSQRCLIRKVSNLVEGEVTSGGVATVMLEGIQEFGLRYIGKGKQDWVSGWDSKNSPDASIKNNFPEAVEISLTVERGSSKKKSISMQIVAPIRNPNNRTAGGTP